MLMFNWASKTLTERDKAERFRLEQQVDVLSKQNAALRSAIRKLRSEYQQVVLLAGLRGLAVSVKPAVPAQPEKLIMRKVKGEI